MKKLAPLGSILAGTLQGVFSTIQTHIGNPNSFNLKNVLLCFYNGNKTQPPNEINGDFLIVGIDYSDRLKNGNLIQIWPT